MDRLKDAEGKASANTDHEIWRETPGDYYAPSIHVTEGGGIGLNVGGNVIVLPIRELHRRALSLESVRSEAIKGHCGTRWEVSADGNMVTLVFDTLTNMENFLTHLRALSPARVAEGEAEPESELGRQFLNSLADIEIPAPESPAKEQPGEQNEN